MQEGKQIDWSKAPEGATHYHPENNQFYVAAGGKDFHIAGHEDYGRVMVNAAWISGLVQRPVVWNGEGLPPVGTVCEFCGGVGDQQDPWRRGLRDGVEVEIIAHFDAGVGAMVAAFTFDDTHGDVTGRQVEQAIASCFRPIRTPEQIAAEEREKTINAMYDCVFTYRSEDIPLQKKVCADLYDAGYRKVEGGAE